VTHPAVDPSRLLRPRRAGVDVLRAAADEGGDDAEVWERLAARGHIPASWTTSERRAFSAWCHACKGLGFAYDDHQPRHCPVCHGATQLTSPQPPAALAWCVASDVAGVERAEALAEELCARLVACGMRPCGERVYWRVAAAPMTLAMRRWKGYRGPFPPFGPYARGEAEAVFDADLRARGEVALAADVFDPLVQLYELGYAVDTVLGSGPMLVAPAW
jgi:hypothetical protein